MSTLVPLLPASERSTHAYGAHDETLVVWDIEDYKIPESIDPCLINDKIARAIVKRPHIRMSEVSIWIFGSPENAWLTESQDKLWESEFEVYLPKGDKRTRLNMILAEVIYHVWSLDDPINLLVLSENKEKMEQDPKFCRFRQALQNKGFFVALAHPETLINQETAVEEPPDFTPIPYYQTTSDNTLKLAYWTKEDDEAFRSNHKEVRGGKMPRTAIESLCPWRRRKSLDKSLFLRLSL